MKKIKISQGVLVEMIVVALLLALGALVRFFKLDCLPPGLYPDEAMNLTDGLRVATAGGWQWFFENNNGREGLYINLIGYMLSWFGANITIVRFLPALIGTLTLPAVYWLGRRALGRFGGLISLGLIAFSYWHINFSRIGFRAILMVFMLSWSFAFLWEGFSRMLSKKTTKNNISWLFFFLGGIFMGLSLHTYIAVRIAPAVIVVLWLLIFIFFSSYWKKTVKFGFIFLVGALIAAAPMIYDFVGNPQHFSSRTSNVSVLNSPNMMRDLGKSVGLTLASFVFYGDQNWRHNYPWLPLTLPWWGVMVFVGVVWGIIKFIKEIFKKIIRKGTVDPQKNLELVFWIFIVAWWGFLLLPSMLTNEGLPHALRSIGSLPPTFLIIALVANKWAKKKKWQVCLYGLVVVSAFISVYAYFFLWGNNPVTYGAFEHRLSGMGIYMRDTMPQDKKNNYYLITNESSQKTDWGYPVSVEPIRFYTWQYSDRLSYVLPEDLDQKEFKLPAKIFLMQDDEALSEIIKKRYPSAERREFNVGKTPEQNSQTTVFAPAGEECFLNPAKPVDSRFVYWEVSE